MIFNKSKIEYVIFDVDGALYHKQREYPSKQGTVEEAHEFFRYITYIKAVGGRFPTEETFQEISAEFRFLC